METSVSEFSLIEQFFSNGSADRADVCLGVGDDAALVHAGPGHQVLTALATQSGNKSDASAASLGKHALATAMTRVAAMGARPAWASLALTLPDADMKWLGAFSDAFLDLARRHEVTLIGGDTTRGEPTVTVFVQGLAPCGRRLRPGGARPDETVFLVASPDPGDPPASVGPRLLDIASAAVDVTGDLEAAISALERDGGVALDIERARIALPRHTDTTAPDYRPEYRICFTALAERGAALGALGDESQCSGIGTVRACRHGLG